MIYIAILSELHNQEIQRGSVFRTILSSYGAFIHSQIS